MATNSNSVTLVGNLTRDPELRYTTSGRAVLTMGIAVNRRYQVNGEWQEEVSFFNVVAWADLAENTAATLDKGSRAIVFGRLQQREYENNEGEKRTVVEIVADDIGPSLRWAQAEVERNERSSSPPPPDDGAAPDAPAKKTAAKKKAAAGSKGRKQDPEPDEEEPPF